ncbi:MAG: thiamine pyrophosphate-binding protein [Candidatus Latescibacterota bacterium]|nr:thiamine pyrophosphate-binding protein [Candidatus Latescibacterota bacterium]
MKASDIVDALKANGVTHVVGLPDNGSRALFELLWADSNIDVIGVTREGEAFAVASGMYLGGYKPVVIIQNTGFLETGDAFRGTAYNMGLPLVMLMGYRGIKTMQSGTARVDTAATFFEPTLKAWDIPYSVLDDDNQTRGQIDEAFALANERSLPAAVLLATETE